MAVGRATALPTITGYATSGSASSSLGWTGEQTDANGFVYLRARYYNPVVGRFFQRDTWRGDSRRPKSLNAYMYSEGNPILNTDVTGHFVCPSGAGPGCFEICMVSVVECMKCLAKGLSDLEESIDENAKSIAKNATVVITEGVDDLSKGCLPPVVTYGCSNFGSSQLGTVTDEGIWTHDHFGDGEGYIRDTGVSFQWLYDTRRWLRIEGSKGSRYFRIRGTSFAGGMLQADIDPKKVRHGSGPTKGTMLLPVDGSLIGETVTRATWMPSQYKVYFAWVPGSNSISQGFLSYSKVTMSEGFRGGPINGWIGLKGACGEVTTDEGIRTVDETTCPYIGDSGGGLFNRYGDLIGVYHTVEFVGNYAQMYLQFGSGFENPEGYYVPAFAKVKP